jgi:DNA-binding transcriptional LysR family regulator
MEVRLIPRLPQVPSRSHPALSLWFDKAPQPGEFAVRLGQVPYGHYGAAGPSSRDWVTILDEDFPGQPIVRAMEQQRRRQGGMLRLTATDSCLLAAAIRSGLGRGLLPLCQGDESPGLERQDSGAPLLMRSLHLQAHPDTVQMARVQAAIRWLRGSFAEVFAAPKDGPI